MERPDERHLLIRADASTRIGTGHLMRCLALAQAWKDAGGQVVFITSCQNEGLLHRLQEEEFDVRVLACPYPDLGDWDYTKDIVASYPNAWVVLDGYHFDEVYQQMVKQAGHRLLVIDDMAHLKHYYADIILNQNLHADQLCYSCEPYTRLLLGTEYVLLRREFLAWRDWKREAPETARRLLVTLGGSDPENYTLEVIQALQLTDSPGLEATVVIGAGNPHAETLKASIRQGSPPIRLVSKVKNMPELMAWADVAVASAGTTTWELLFLGTPALFLILADNQSLVAQQIEGQKIGKTVGWAGRISVRSLAESIDRLAKDSRLRAEMSANARRTVDGRGTERVVTALHQTRTHGLKLRPVTPEDCRLLWEWANDPVVRAASFSSALIVWEEHVNWFQQKLADPHCPIYIILDKQETPVGQVRFDTSGNEAEISASISSPYRGYGYGVEAIDIASEYLFQETAVSRVYASIKLDNVVSHRAFTEAGYREIGVEVVKGSPALRMVLDENEKLSKRGCY
jgi:UDP-2,4-diacetamido-2,4,6-trideoxy-beta-L-altropyranose hydrolase